MSRPPATRFVAHYFPQFHRIPENDEWWGEGFTDWTNVGRAGPLFPGHYQPRVPRDGRYDLSRLDVVRRQADLAGSHGIAAFCHYHYWFDGKQLLQTPTDLFLDHRDINLGICLAWANESWSRRWDGQDHLLLIRQTYPESRERWDLHFQYLQRAFTDPRALTVYGRPIFLIYRPSPQRAFLNMLEYFRERAQRIGLPGLYLVAMDQSRVGDDKLRRHFDAEARFEPFAARYYARDRDRPVFSAVDRTARAIVPKQAYNWLERLLHRLDDGLAGPTRLDYERIWEEIATRPLPADRVVFPGAFVDWDNTARYGRHATLFDGASPEVYERGLARLAERVAGCPEQERLIFINAWNEWGEGCYLEPDERYGMDWLEATKQVAERYVS